MGKGVARRVVATLSAGAVALAPAAGVSQVPGVQRKVELVDPLIGTATTLGLQGGGGNVTPGAQIPFGFVSLGPDTSKGYSSGYDEASPIIGFSHTHVSGTGGPSKYGNFRVLPAIGDAGFINPLFARSGEKATPGYYAVTLGREDKAIGVELTASRRAGFHRYTFPATEHSNVLIDVTSVIPMRGEGQRVTSATVSVDDNRHVSGSVSVTGGWSPEPYTLFFAAEFDRAPTAFGRWRAGRGNWSRLSGSGVTAGGDQRTEFDTRLGSYATFDTRLQRDVQLKLAVSFRNVDRARRTLAEEQPGWDFAAARARAAAEWEEALGTIDIEGGDATDRRMFYSALYRSQMMPHDITGENVWWGSEDPLYTDYYAIWDIFRTVSPLMTLIQPQRQRDMVRSLLAYYRYDGWLPDAYIAGATGPTQGGSNADILIGDAIVKDLGGFDTALALEAMTKNGEVEIADERRGRRLRDYLAHGYVPTSQTGSVSRTLEYAYDDFVIGLAAQHLGKRKLADRYLRRGGNWRNLWNAEDRCMRPRLADGTWMENFDCDYEYPDRRLPWHYGPFYEGTARQYTTFVPQDFAGLVQRLGGPDQAVKWLDAFFAEGHYNPGNEPNLLAPFIYSHAGRQDLAARTVRSLMAAHYRPTANGLPGQDDSGTLSAWYVWNAIGLYPNAGQPIYYIGSPIFPKATLKLESGRTFTVAAPSASPKNIYVQSALLNGRPVTTPWISHSDVVRGGTLVLTMGPQQAKWP